MALQFPRAHVDVGGVDRNTHQSLNPAKAHGIDGNVEIVTELHRGSYATLDVDRDDSSKSPHLLLR